MRSSFQVIYQTELSFIEFNLSINQSNGIIDLALISLKKYLYNVWTQLVYTLGSLKRLIGKCRREV